MEAWFGGESFIDKNIYKILLVNEYILILIPTLLYSVYARLDFKEVFRLNRLEMLPALIILLITIPASFAADMLNTVAVYVLQFIGDIPPQPIPVPKNG